MWSSQLPCEGCGWAGCHPQQQGPGVEKAAAAVSSVQTCCLFFPVGFVPLVGKVVKCVSFLHWLTKSVALVWKWQEKKCAGWRHIQSSVKRFNPQGWIWVQFAWKSFASRGGDVQGFASAAAPLAIREMRAVKHTHHLRAFPEIIIKAEAHSSGVFLLPRTSIQALGRRRAAPWPLGGDVPPGTPGSERRDPRAALPLRRCQRNPRGASGGLRSRNPKTVLCTTAERALSSSGKCPPEVSFFMVTNYPWKLLALSVTRGD